MSLLSLYPRMMDGYSIDGFSDATYVTSVSLLCLMSTVLHVLALPHPYVLLPGNRLTILIPRETGDELLALIEECEETEVEGHNRKPFLIAVLPSIQPQPPNSVSNSEWATAARVLRLVNPPPEHSLVPGAPNTSYLLSLQGLTRIKLLGPSKNTPKSFTALLPYTVSHASASDSEQLEPETLIKFKQSAIALLDRLTRYSVQSAKRDAYIKLADLLNDLDVHSSSSESLSRAAWVADVLVGNVVRDYDDKLGQLSYFVLLVSG